MANKEEVLQSIRVLAEQQAITKDELLQAYHSGNGVAPPAAQPGKYGMAEVLYYIGGGIICSGIAILAEDRWPLLGFWARLLITLGFGITTYLIGVFLHRRQSTKNASAAFFLIAAIATPFGLGVIIDYAGFDVDSFGSQSLISGIMLAVYLLSLRVYRKNIFALFSIVFGTWLYFSLTSMVWSGEFFSKAGISPQYSYRIIIAGIAYILIGYAFTNTRYAVLQEWLYHFGVLGFLAATFSLGGWKPYQSMVWTSLFPLFVFGTLFLSVFLKSNACLSWSTIFLMGYILKISSEYFSHSLGWPLTLVIAGLAMIAVGDMSLSIKKRLFKSM